MAIWELAEEIKMTSGEDQIILASWKHSQICAEVVDEDYIAGEIIDLKNNTPKASQYQNFQTMENLVVALDFLCIVF